MPGLAPSVAAEGFLCAESPLGEGGVAWRCHASREAIRVWMLPQVWASSAGLI